MENNTVFQYYILKDSFNAVLFPLNRK